jgi:hypothetical protein
LSDVFDGSYTLKGAGWVVLIPAEGNTLKFTIELDFSHQQCVAEYEGLVIGLWLAKGLRILLLLI